MKKILGTGFVALLNSAFAVDIGVNLPERSKGVESGSIMHMHFVGSNATVDILFCFLFFSFCTCLLVVLQLRKCV